MYMNIKMASQSRKNNNWYGREDIPDMKKIKTIITLLSILSLVGCVSRSGIIESQKKANESLPTIRYKSDINMPFGQMAAIYNNHLYYCDNKDSGTGIYKSDLSSGKEELIIEVENIRKIQVTEDGVYYIGRTPENDIEKNDSDAEWNTYQLFFHKGHGNTGVKDKLLAEAIHAWDFYVADEGIYFVTVISGIPTGKIKLRKYFLENDGTYLTWRDMKVIVERITEEISISEFAKLTLGSRFRLKEEWKEQITAIASVYDREQDKIVYGVSDRIRNEAHYCYMLLTSHENNYLCTEDNNLYLVDENGICKQATIDSVEKIKFGFKQGNQMYLISSMKNQEYIHALNLDTFEVETIRELGKNERVVAMTDEGFLCSTTKKILLRDIQNGEIVHSQSWNKKINWDKNTIEMAGDYIFVYEYKNGISIREKQRLAW